MSIANYNWPRIVHSFIEVFQMRIQYEYPMWKPNKTAAITNTL